MLRFFLISSLLSSSFLYAEKSAFGLSESEKIIFDNKKRIKYQENKILELNEKLEGVRSVVDSISLKLGKTSQRVNSIDTQVSQDEIEKIKSDIVELKRVQSENYEKINSVLMKLSSMIDKINADYVTSDELNSKSKRVKKTTESSVKKPKLTNSQRLKDAVALYRKKHYTKAFDIFLDLANNSYKPATSNYYLGEISYYKKRYSDAIVYYKKSVGYYDRASYMPTLLLHTGISFDKLNDIENRDKFFDVLLSSYPQSQEAKIAKDYLK